MAMITLRIEIFGLSAVTQEAIVSNLERIGVRYSLNLGFHADHIRVEVDEPLQMQKLTSFLLANPIRYSFLNPTPLANTVEYPSYGIELPAATTEEALEQVKKPWSSQRDPVSYLRKLMTEVFGLSTENPLEVDELWLKGYNPPRPPKQTI